MGLWGNRKSKNRDSLCKGKKSIGVMYEELMIFMAKQEILWALPPSPQKEKGGETQNSLLLVISNSSMPNL